MCQHGSNECAGNRLEGCAIRHNPDPKKYLPFIFCFEGDNGSDLSYAMKCANSTGLDYKQIDQCVRGPEGDAADAFNAKQTAAFGTSRPGTPWVLVNGEVVKDVDNVLQAVCDAITGTKPKGCTAAAVSVATAKVAEDDIC